MSRMVEVSDETYQRVLGYVCEFGESFDMVLTRLLNVLDGLGRNGHEAASTPAAQAEVREDEPAHIVQPGQMLLHAMKRLRQTREADGSPYELKVPTLIETDKHFRTSRNIFLPIGAPLRAFFKGFRVDAMITPQGIEYAGKYYDNPSKAAVDAKVHMGAPDEKSAQSNGWSFWQIEIPSGSGNWRTLDTIRRRQMGANEGDVE